MKPQCKMEKSEIQLRENIRKVLRDPELWNEEKLNKIYDLVR